MAESEIEIQANYLGYNDAEAMFKDMYVEQKLSMLEISVRLGIGNATVARWLRKLDIPRRSQGGANHHSRLHYILHLMDQRWVFSTPVTQIAAVLRMNPVYVYKYRKFVKGGNIELRTDSTNQPDGSFPDRPTGIDGLGPRKE